MKIFYGYRWMLVLLSCFSMIACEKKEIQFATALGETYTNILQIDTVAINMETFLSDSFPTNSIESFSIGSYTDSLLGVTTAKPFLQLGLPDDLTVETASSFDSLSLVIRFNKYFYGDTLQTASFTVRELAASIEYSYGSYLFNTSSISEKQVPLGSLTTRIYPSVTDSIIIPLSKTKGNELFQKLQQQATEIMTADAFLSYFRGISIESQAPAPGNVFGITVAPDSIYMRLSYHTTTPYKEPKFKDFRFNKSIYFNHLSQNRSATPLAGGAKLTASTSTFNKAYTQSGTGTLLKLTFPSLRNILKLDPTVKLLKATLVLEVATGSYDGKTPLPTALFLASTDATNTIGNYLADSSGSAQLYARPVSDDIYSSGTRYTFNVSAYINTLLTTAGSENSGLFLLEESPGSLTTINRGVFNNSGTTVRASKLSLSILTFNNKQ